MICKINTLQQGIKRKLTDDTNELQTQKPKRQQAELQVWKKRLGRTDCGNVGADVPDARKDNYSRGEIEEKQYSNLWRPRRKITPQSHM